MIACLRMAICLECIYKSKIAHVMHTPLALHSHIERGNYRAYEADFALHNIGFGEENRGQEQEQESTHPT